MPGKETTEHEGTPTAPKGARPYSARRSDASGGQGQTSPEATAGKGKKAMKGSDLRKAKKH